MRLTKRAAGKLGGGRPIELSLSCGKVGGTWGRTFPMFSCASGTGNGARYRWSIRNLPFWPSAGLGCESSPQWLLSARHKASISKRPARIGGAANSARRGLVRIRFQHCLPVSLVPFPAPPIHVRNTAPVQSTGMGRATRPRVLDLAGHHDRAHWIPFYKEDHTNLRGRRGAGASFRMRRPAQHWTLGRPSPYEPGPSEEGGAPGGTRTPGLLVRSQSLYPTELRARTRTKNHNMRRRIVRDGA